MAEFGLNGLDLTITEADGSLAVQAGSHPSALTTSLAINSTIVPGLGEVPDGQAKDLQIDLPPGLVGDPNAVPHCAAADFADITKARPACPDATAIGVASIRGAFSAYKPGENGAAHVSVYNLVPPPGVAAELGFNVLGVPVTVDIRVSPDPPYHLIASLHNISQAVLFYGSKVTVWGYPADHAHDPLRGSCLKIDDPGSPELASLGECPTNGPEKPFLTLPRSCQGPLTTLFSADSWELPGVMVEGTATTHDDSVPPNPLGMSGCGKLAFAPTIAATPTSRAAASPTGLDFSLDVKDEGLPSPTGLASADIRKSVVTLPEGFSVNPAVAEGLEVCSEAQLAAETAASLAGAGCPAASKIGSVEVETPLLDEDVDGALYQAAPYENPFGSLIALYVVIKNPKLGIVIKQPLKVESDPLTGRITTVADEMPQFPFSHFRLHFREGARSPLVTPPACGLYDGNGGDPEPVKATLYPSSGAAPVTTTAAFSIVSGPEGQACPSAGLPPFHPHLTAGTLNNFAGHFSPFTVKITRSDAEQEITHFSIKLPPGVAGKLAGIPFCTDAQIARAAARTGPHGGREELDDPSCPAASQVGRTLAGSGVGPSLAYAPGKIYLAGPYHGAPISMVAITSGVVGPFDVGTVVVRLAIKVNPETGEIFLDSTGSDPIPHIIKGIPLHLRDIRAYADRPEFTFNPTSCEPTSTSATVLGAGGDFVSAADDNPFVSTSPFQAVDCAALPFKPKLTLTLKGSPRRSGNPALHAHLAMNGFGEAGLAYVQVALPRNEFLDNSHIGTLCTRVQFREGAVEGEKCPERSIIGHARAVTPILEAPLEGPIYLRSNPERELPDLAAALHGQQINVVAVGHTDSAKGGGLRNTFEVIPDAPITSVDFNLFGGKRGLLENSPSGLANTVCGSKLKAKTKLTGHNGKAYNRTLTLKFPSCKKKGKTGSTAR
jgi:hypothetical protein